MKEDLTGVYKAQQQLEGISMRTPLDYLENFSRTLDGHLFAKREDLQAVRSYKLRGAFVKIAGLPDEVRAEGVICASAGNHAQGVAYACNKLDIACRIYMPVTTPNQKLTQVRFFGNSQAEIILVGDTFDEAYRAAGENAKLTGQAFIHPFDDPSVINGQATVALEILEQATTPIDYLFLPIGGGGLASGAAMVFKTLSPSTRLIGVEPEGAPSMKKAFEAGEPVLLESIDSFTDGAAVKKVGNLTYSICKDRLDDIILVPEGLICETILRIYNENAIVAEPAGALALAGAVMMKSKLWGMTSAAVISGGNNDITRFPEIKERALLYANLKHYFIVSFPQRPGALKQFVQDILGPDDDIVHFEYSKKTSRENGPALIGIELKRSSDFEPLVQRMKEKNFPAEYVNDRIELMQFLI
ncbi:MAG: threonine ammonia-lyase IlvA [Bacteroidales bacterium]|jgi:threonine dehydratase